MLITFDNYVHHIHNMHCVVSELLKKSLSSLCTYVTCCVVKFGTQTFYYVKINKC